MPELTTYLKKLQFDKSQENTFFAKYLRNTRLVILIILLLCIIGISSFINLPRVLNPEVKIPFVIVSTILPGASPQDIESLVTIPLEDSVDDVQKIKKIESTSRESASIITIEFENGVDADKAKADVQSAIDSVNTLPQNTQTPRVQKLDFSNAPVWTFTLSSKNDAISLIRFGRILRDKLKDLPSINKVETTGLDDEEIQVTIRPEKIAEYNINPALLSQSIKSNIKSFPAGTVSTGTSSFVLNIDPTITSIEDIRKLTLSVGKTTYLLSEIADVQRRSKPNTTTTYIADSSKTPVEAIRFDIYKSSTANITTAVADAKKLTEEITKEYKDTFTILTIEDAGNMIDKQFNHLVRDLTLTISLVFITLFLFLGIRQAIVASLAIPLTFFLTFTVMDMTGIDLSFIAFFSLLLSLGLLVDDTIVVISAVTAYYRTGKFTPLEASIMVWRDFKTALLTTTLTTVWAFVPLLLTGGIIGEFIRPIPIVVSSTLLGSLIIALFITLPVIIILLTGNMPKRVIILLRIIAILIVLYIFTLISPQGNFFIPAILLFILNLFVFMLVKNTLFGRATSKLSSLNTTKKSGRNYNKYINHGVINFEYIEKKYRSIIDTILSKHINRKATLIIVIVFSLFSYLLFPLGFVRNEFFPATDQEYIYLSLELPSGANQEITRKESIKILEQLRNLPETTFVTATLGLSANQRGGYAAAGENVALITIILPDDTKRDITSIDLARDLRKQFQNYSKGTIAVTEVTDGPPAGSDVQIKLSGEDLTQLETYANTLQEYLKKQPGTNNVEKSIKEGTSKIVFIPNKQKLIDAGISEEQIGLYLRSYVNGFNLDENVRFQNESNSDETIVLRTSPQQPTTDVMGNITIPTQQGNVNINALGSFELRPNPTLITREDGKRTISVSAGVDKGYSITDINNKLTKYADTIQLNDGYSWSTGGVNEENNKSVISILQAMILSFLLIIITMVMQFSSFRKAFIVMLVIPLSISGVLIIFGLTNTPLTFPALIGTLALFGIVVKNAILIVDKINSNLKEKIPFKEAIAEGAESRLEPITLTTIATIMGLIPITLSDPLWQGLGGAIISGLFFSGTMMLFFIPVVYYYMFRNSEGK